MEMQMQTPEIIKIMNKRFGHDCLIALATCENNIPTVSTLNAYYENGAFYIMTSAVSKTIRQIENNPDVAVSDEIFSAHGKAANLGCLCQEDNKEISDRLREIFFKFNYLTRNDPDNIHIIRVFLTHGTLISEGRKYNINFLMR